MKITRLLIKLLVILLIFLFIFDSEYLIELIIDSIFPPNLQEEKYIEKKLPSVESNSSSLTPSIGEEKTNLKSNNNKIYILLGITLFALSLVLTNQYYIILDLQKKQENLERVVSELVLVDKILIEITTNQETRMDILNDLINR
jgi:hypothetical protein